ncbi:hypothetical protein BZA70DRAFT_159427 [Myxozyma melibiosi]|uniref:Secreted protein n=1 Tax=Myxozyma melibiosi TaxID=54550 RepID=A0ABR1F8J9_9ASCO
MHRRVQYFNVFLFLLCSRQSKRAELFQQSTAEYTTEKRTHLIMAFSLYRLMIIQDCRELFTEHLPSLLSLESA